MKTVELEKLIRRSLIELAEIANEKEQGQSVKKQESKLIFPIKSNKNNDVRISEQEIRFLFVRELEKSKYFEGFYSVETPTKKTYKFTDKGEKIDPKILPVEQGGQSASFDLTIYDTEFNRKHFIEFKNENVDTVKKDFLKLLCDEKDKKNYLIHIIDRKNNLRKRKTLDSLKDKYDKAIKNAKTYQIVSTLNVVLFNIKDGEQIWFEEITKETIKIEEKNNSA